jgi:hypothetical protein
LSLAICAKLLIKTNMAKYLCNSLTLRLTFASRHVISTPISRNLSRCVYYGLESLYTRLFSGLQVMPEETLFGYSIIDLIVLSTKFMSEVKL